MQSPVGRLYRYMQKQEDLDYSKGYNSYVANDLVPPNELVYATDTRISTLGRQTTRQGLDFYSVPAGEASDAFSNSLAGPADQNVGTTDWIATKFTAGATKRLSRMDLRCKSTTGTGPLIVEIRSDNIGSPGAVLATSSADNVSGAYSYKVFRFVEAPLVTSGTSYWIVAYLQDNGTGHHQLSSTTASTNAKTSSDSGVTWVGVTWDINYTIYLATNGGVLGHIRATKSDGTSKTVIAYREAAGTTGVGVIDDLTGTITNIKSGLSASATRYKFVCVSDTVYYVNGYDAPRKWDFTTESAMGGSPAVSSDIELHVNALFFVQASDPTRIFFSNTGSFETFTSTNFFYVPSPKNADFITRVIGFNNQNLVIFTRRTKWVLSGSDISVMRLNRAIGQKGCIAYDSIQKTLTAIYFCSDDGFYKFNGSVDQLLSVNVTTEYLQAANRSNMGSALWNNRYYVFFTPAGSSGNHRCWVYNIVFNSIESQDRSAYVQKCATWDGPSDDGRMVQASNLVGAIYYAELSSNNYSQLGKPLTWELRTKYDHFGNPATGKHVKRWYPRFSSEGSYSVDCQYDKDFLNSPTSTLVNLNGSGITFGGGHTFGDGSVFGASALIDPRLTIPGLAHYIQRRFKRTGVNTPVEFIGQTVYYLVRRPR